MTTDTKDEDDALDLLGLLPEDVVNHKWCFDSYRYADWEWEIATPALLAMGFRVGRWRTTDGDSFGPLVRAVDLTKDGVRKTYVYG